MTFTFYVLGSSQTYILFDYMEFASGQSGQFPVGCGESYYTSVWQIPSTETFWQWSTSAGGSFTNPNTNWTTYNAGSTGGIVYAILNDTSSAIPTELTQPGGYYVTGLSSTTSEVDAYFTVPALTYLPNAYGENQLAFVISLGGFTAPNGEEAWQLWFYINVSSSGPTYQGAFEGWNFDPLVGPFFDPIANSQNIKPGDTISMDISLLANCDSAGDTAVEFHIGDAKAAASYTEGWCNVHVSTTSEWWGVEDPPACPADPNVPEVCYEVPEFSAISVSHIAVITNGAWSNPMGSWLHMDGDDMGSTQCLDILPQDLSTPSSFGSTGFSVDWSYSC